MGYVLLPHRPQANPLSSRLTLPPFLPACIHCFPLHPPTYLLTPLTTLLHPLFLHLSSTLIIYLLIPYTPSTHPLVHRHLLVGIACCRQHKSSHTLTLAFHICRLNPSAHPLSLPLYPHTPLHPITLLLYHIYNTQTLIITAKPPNSAITKIITPAALQDITLLAVTLEFTACLKLATVMTTQTVPTYEMTRMETKI